MHAGTHARKLARRRHDDEEGRKLWDGGTFVEARDRSAGRRTRPRSSAGARPRLLQVARRPCSALRSERLITPFVSVSPLPRSAVHPRRERRGQSHLVSALASSRSHVGTHATRQPSVQRKKACPARTSPPTGVCTALRAAQTPRSLSSSWEGGGGR